MKGFLKATSLTLVLCLMIAVFFVSSASGADDDVNIVYDLVNGVYPEGYTGDSDDGIAPTITVEGPKFKVTYDSYEEAKGFPDANWNDIAYFPFNVDGETPAVGYDYIAFWLDTTGMK